jgi:hypothetical protein
MRSAAEDGTPARERSRRSWWMAGIFRGAHLAHVARVERVDDRARREEEQALKMAWTR